jgi:glycosyltransferase involved in cell wall biosynthesis
LRILFFLGFANPFPGAGWTRIAFFAKYFKDRGYDVAVVGIFSPKSLRMAGFKRWKGIPIYNVIPTFWVENIFSLAFNILSSMILAPIIFLALKPKVVVISLPSGEPAVGAYFASKFIRAKTVFDVRDEWEDYAISKASSKAFREAYKLLKTLMTSLYDKAVLVIAVLHPIARSLILRGVRRVSIVPNGADVNVFRPYGKDVIRRRLGLKNDDFIIVYEGGVGGYYRLDVVVRAIAKLDDSTHSKIRLLIVGFGDMLSVLKLAEDFELKDNVIYLGVKNDKVELAQTISSSDVGIIPLSLDYIQAKSALPVKFFEYCACGVPVVATVPDDSVLAKLIKECKVGISVPSMDEKKLAEAIYQIYENKPFREAAGKRARQLIEKKFDRNKIAEEYLNLIEKLVRR